MTPVGVGIVQTCGAVIDTRTRAAEMSRQIATLARDGAKVIVLPEFSLTGYDLAVDQRELAERAGGSSLVILAQWAEAYRCTLITALPLVDDTAELRDRPVIVAPDGSYALGDKRFLWGGEREIFAAGAPPSLLAKIDGVTIGVAVCYEAGFPEIARELAVAGAQIIAVPAAFGRARRHVWDLLTRARAIENGCVIAAAGLCGENAHGVAFAGHSTIVDPFGTRLVELADEPGFTSATVNLDDIDRARRELPYLADLAGAKASAPLMN